MFLICLITSEILKSSLRSIKYLTYHPLVQPFQEIVTIVYLRNLTVILVELGFELLPCYPALTPSNLFLLPILKIILPGQKFLVKWGCHRRHEGIFCRHTINVILTGLKKLELLWVKCIELNVIIFNAKSKCYLFRPSPSVSDIVIIFPKFPFFFVD